MNARQLTGLQVCTSADAFVNRAIEFGNDRTLLQTFRDRLRTGQASCSLFDMPSLLHHLENLYGRMWSEFEDGDLPRPALANLNAYLEIGCQVSHDEIEVQLIRDYHGWWLKMLAQRHRLRPMLPERRASALGPSEIAWTLCRSCCGRPLSRSAN